MDKYERLKGRIEALETVVTGILNDRLNNDKVDEDQERRGFIKPFRCYVCGEQTEEDDEHFNKETKQYVCEKVDKDQGHPYPPAEPAHNELPWQSEIFRILNKYLSGTQKEICFLELSDLFEGQLKWACPGCMEMCNKISEILNRMDDNDPLYNILYYIIEGKDSHVEKGGK
jgi:hypothetical protein